MVEDINEFIFAIREIEEEPLKIEDINKEFDFPQYVSSRRKYWICLESGSNVDKFLNKHLLLNIRTVTTRMKYPVMQVYPRPTRW